MVDLYNFDINRFFAELDTWLRRHPGVTNCNLRPTWKEEYLRLDCDHCVLDIGLELRANHEQETLHVTRHSSIARGDFDLTYRRRKRFNAEALAYAYLAAAYLTIKGVETVIHPTVDGIAKLKSFVEIPNTF